MNREALAQNLRLSFPPELAAELLEQLDLEEPNTGAAEGAQARGVATLWAGDRLYQRTATGQIEGLIQLIWDGTDRHGADQFRYEPHPTQPFSYVCANGRRITPQWMTTDGGSIPRPLHGIGAYSPWRYGPAFVIHDWLFVAHKHRLGIDDDYTLEGAADVMVEVMKTQMEHWMPGPRGRIPPLGKAEDVMWSMHKAVQSRIARKMWDAIAASDERSLARGRPGSRTADWA